MLTQIQKPQQRLSLAMLASGALLLLLIVLVAIRLADVTGRSAQQALEDRNLRAVATLVHTAALDAETGQRGYLLTRQDRYLEPYRSGLARLDEALPRLRAEVSDDKVLSEAAGRLALALADKRAEMSATIDLARAGRTDEALAMIHTNRGRGLMDQVRTESTFVIRELETRVQRRLADSIADARLLRLSAILGAVFAAAFAGGAFVLTLRQMRELDTAQQELAVLNQGLELRVAERTAELTQANEEIQRFAYIVSHDLRAPLVNVMGFTKELEVGAESIKRYFETADADADPAAREAARLAAAEDLPEAARFIRASTAKMDRLINAILKLSREGRRTLNIERVHLKELVGAAAAAMRHQAEATATVVDLPANDEVIVSDRLALEQIVGNLLDNALKYLKPDRPGRIGVTIAGDRSSVQIAIRDNGRGIADEDQKRIFEPFRRAGPQDRPGEGIGLAQVQALVRRLGGRITVTSKLDDGATFEVELPRRTKA